VAQVTLWKDNIYFVLVEPREPGNIGASARAIKNMGFKNLVLVNPLRPEGFDIRKIRKNLEKSEARWLATGAIDVLKKAEIVRNLNEAIMDKGLVVGTTRRIGKRRGVILPVHEGIKKIKEIAEDNRVAILFGREEKGLYNDEVKRCGFLMTIETSKNAPSLNLSQAALLVAYELSRLEHSDKLEVPPVKLVNQADIDNLLKRIEEALLLLGYIPRGDRDLHRKIMLNMGYLLRRAGLTEWELNMLHGICTKIMEVSKHQVVKYWQAEDK
jgi:TrmH family RNA methyltransferase